MSKKYFFSEFLKQSKHIGSVTPSSKFLVKKMVENINFTNVKCIVEFGPGTGIITKELLSQMPPDSLLLAFEINEDFCKILKKIKDPRLKVIQDSAEKLESYLKEFNIIKVDYIVSSLPVANIPTRLIDSILQTVKKVLFKNGAFIQYQYSLNAYKRLRNTFKKVELNFTPMNIPPAFIFTCSL